MANPLRRRAKANFLSSGTAGKTQPMDQWLLIAVFALLVFGLIMITSIGVPKSIQLSAPDMLYPNCQSPEVDCYLVLKNHAKRLAIGIILFTILLKVHYLWWKKFSVLFFFGAIGLLVAVLFFGSDYNTFARSWINIPSLPIIQTLQPTEVAKLAMIFYFANWLDKKQREKEINTFYGGFFAFCVVAGLIILPVIAQPDLGSTLVLASIAVGMYFIAGADWKHLGVGFMITVMLGGIAIASSDRVQQRFGAFFNSTTECAEDYCWQSEQSKIAVGSGGFWGRGLTQGIQKSYWLPQASDDFIFAASAEELGFLRTLLVVFAYGVILYRGLQIANYAPDNFSRLAAAGITVWITAQAFINIAVNISLMPVTGITLPFVSYGGSSLVLTLIGVSVLLNISQYVHKRAPTAYGRRNGGTRPAAYRRA